ncbi:dienelactone hydrolase family protein [Flavivirga amylovorans]|uniref:Dienelactone hydrolase family protein n=1 Tax=Flavivirga amylovorans TaxID=870486 RepID=A0ABT8X4E7_9FLAO|nr:dienelactone hydrolase family protein [Flavivirga amylovorans]MDO5988464.1 dienelactone hydrolase family protein [Flavivirga amylovorans]
MKTLLNLLIISPFLFLSCNNDDTIPEENQNDLESLPKDLGGAHKAYTLDNTNAKFGHYIYTPSDYNSDSFEYPLLIFLHGSGERGNSETNPDILNKVLVNGPPKLIAKNEWSPKYPMLVASPQLPSGNWNPEDIHDFIAYLIANYKVNTKRIYLTGLSLGGFGSFNYISRYGSEAYTAAIVPIAGGGSKNSGDKFTTIPVWAFHGDNDNVVSHNKSIDMVNAINTANPNTPAKLTIYPGVKHNSWARTYNGSGMGDESNTYDAFNTTIYDWMFMFEK